MTDLIIAFTIGNITGITLLLAGFRYIITTYANAADINDQPCLVCRMHTCECGETQ